MLGAYWLSFIRTFTELCYYTGTATFEVVRSHTAWRRKRCFHV